MKKKKQNFNAFSISVIALLVVAILGTGVYAYYQTQMSATGDMHAKAWVFTAKGNDKELSDTFSDTIANLQPGASGKYKITVDATGTEVDLDYLVDIDTKFIKTLDFRITHNEIARLFDQGYFAAKRIIPIIEKHNKIM